MLTSGAPGSLSVLFFGGGMALAAFLSLSRMASLPIGYFRSGDFPVPGPAFSRVLTGQGDLTVIKLHGLR